MYFFDSHTEEDLYSTLLQLPGGIFLGFPGKPVQNCVAMIDEEYLCFRPLQLVIKIFPRCLD